MEATAAWESPSDRHDKKRTLEFDCEILAMIDSYPSKSFSSRENGLLLGSSKFLYFKCWF